MEVNQGLVRLERKDQVSRHRAKWVEEWKWERKVEIEFTYSLIYSMLGP